MPHAPMPFIAYRDHCDVPDGVRFEEVAAYLEAGVDITEAMRVTGCTNQDRSHLSRHLSEGRPFVPWVDKAGNEAAAIALRAEAARLTPKED